jgi:hypothetical protein
MKKTYLTVSLAVMVMVAACSTGMNPYYVENPLTGQDLLNRYDKPARILKLDVETEKWIFDEGDEHQIYYLVRNGDVMDSGVEMKKRRM